MRSFYALFISVIILTASSATLRAETPTAKMFSAELVSEFFRRAGMVVGGLIVCNDLDDARVLQDLMDARLKLATAAEAGRSGHGAARLASDVIVAEFNAGSTLAQRRGCDRVQLAMDGDRADAIEAEIRRRVVSGTIPPSMLTR